MSGKRLGLALLSSLAPLLAVGCHATPNAHAPLGARAASACDAFDPLTDLSVALGTNASFGGSSDLFYLVDLDQELGYLALAREGLSHVTVPEARAMDARLGRFAVALTEQRERLGIALADALRTSEAAATALDAAAMCQHFDMRDSSSRKDASGEGATTSKRARDAALDGPACAWARRLWSAVESADLTSVVSSSSIGSHIAELTMSGERAAIRDRLAASLKDHAGALRHFHALAEPKPGDMDDAAKALLALRSEVTESLDSVGRTCRAQTRDDGHVSGGDPEPRIATVTVRPHWSGALANLPHAEEFGSGIVVRWRTASGQVETRIVTNNHVMDGAFEAEIVPGDRDTDRRPEEPADKAPRWSATLLRASSNDDVAVLRVDPNAERLFTKGFALRLTPAREEEAVVAAGFPGVGVRPSFQVTRGTVSNAKFGAEDADATAWNVYVQHTAAIDPGNSGGPLLDAHGSLLGMNTFKVVGRENVALAIPSWRIARALLRADETVVLDARHAAATCNAVVAALAARHPVSDVSSRFGLALYDWSESADAPRDTASFRQAVQGEPADPVDLARRKAYAAVRARVEEEHGVRPFDSCSPLKPGTAPHSFTATFRTRKASHTLTLAEEHGIMRVVRYD